ncbi:MAG: hypothetical protein KF760_18660 [Candidatus Eremiobacteraeota bacterium]|nr:hypothetical protein [Candidatus Eremiobacteraeota bacterium]MCW5867322.1 hypothetical protein [Candidatus Eremiobacteraeota bacterium]
MKKMIAAGLMMLSLGMAAVAEPVEKNATNQPVPAPVVTTTTPVTAPQPEGKKEQAPTQSAPAREKKPVELNFRSF